MKDHRHHTTATDLRRLRDPRRHSTWGQVQGRTVTAWDLSKLVPMEGVAAPTSNSRTLLRNREQERLPAQPPLISQDRTRTIHWLHQSLPTLHHRVTAAEEGPAAGAHLQTVLQATLFQALRAAALPAALARNRRS